MLFSKEKKGVRKGGKIEKIRPRKRCSLAMLQVSPGRGIGQTSKAVPRVGDPFFFRILSNFSLTPIKAFKANPINIWTFYKTSSITIQSKIKKKEKNKKRPQGCSLARKEPTSLFLQLPLQNQSKAPIHRKKKICYRFFELLS